MPVGFVTSPALSWIVGLTLLPFFLQFLGLGLSEVLGQGLCGSALGVSEAEAVRYGLVSEYYLYGQLFLVLLALKVTYALVLITLRFMYPKGEPPFAPWVWRVGVGLSTVFLLLFLLTRTLPLPFATPLGPALLSPAPLDPLSLLMVLPEPPLLFLYLRYRP
ncbi:hypothetical protein [Thermus amyloliquefaciens]|uniref:hypothetical protein n=1 Tax=Thermus amyloliquefaciens TaxID=1449080 RepID=UPI000A6F382B|nr:hypothetical protein [Thermus amyloliquefaciens]